jgi:hypothetical protein
MSLVYDASVQLWRLAGINCWHFEALATKRHQLLVLGIQLELACRPVSENRS